jgi:hypothetical protein
MHKQPRKKRVPIEEYARIHRPDLSTVAAAERLGVNPRTITRFRARLGLSQEHHGATRRLTPEELARVEAMLNDGAPVREVERTFGMCWRTVTKHFPGRAWNRSQIGQYARVVSAHR